MRVLLLRTWLRNIGNGFIDKGAREILNKSLDDPEIIETSGYPFLAADRKGHNRLKERFFPVDTGERQQRYNAFSVPDHLEDIDLAVLPGCVLSKFALRPYLPVIRSLTEREIPLLLLGSGGGSYEKDTRRYVSDWLRNIESIGMITRDQTAYDRYSSEVNYAVSGIDCAFFIDEWYSPPGSNESFVAATFDKTTEPDLAFKTIVRPDHEPFGDGKSYEGLAHDLRRKVENHGQFKKNNVFVSDLLEDYLYIYANAPQTHSDRIHACVPSLVYGNQAKFYFETPRAGLFDSVLGSDIRQNLVSLDAERLREKKEEQVSHVSETVNSIT